MQFYLQASIVEKGIGKKQYSLAKWDVISGCIITDVIAFFVVLACAATLYVSGVRNISDATEAAVVAVPWRAELHVVGGDHRLFLEEVQGGPLGLGV